MVLYTVTNSIGQHRPHYLTPPCCLGVSLRHAGSCHDNIKMEVNSPASMEDVRDPLCSCSLKQKTVCGVNGVSYLNRCFADCEKVHVRNEGPCLTN